MALAHYSDKRRDTLFRPQRLITKTMESLSSARSKLNSALEDYAQACLASVNPTGSDPSPQDIGAESDAFALIKDKTLRIQSTINKARNSLISVVPINSLPDEILVRVFNLVIRAQSFDFEKLVDEDSLHIRTLTISQVCGRWRRVSLSSKTLWSHIDVSILDRVITLGKCLESRSGDQPLSIRIVESRKMWDVLVLPGQFFDFISRVAPRMESLEIAWVLPPHDPSTIFDMLQHSICYSTKQLTRLLLPTRRLANRRHDYHNSSAHWFIVAHNPAGPEPEASESGETLILGDIPHDKYDDILLNIKVLWLDVIYPVWTSKAYYGLTELHLIGPPRLTAIITPQELAAILAASPKLRVLHLGTEIRLTETLPSPIYLEDLEVFLLQSLSPVSQQAILRLILPGRKPLHMSTTYATSDEPFELPAAPEDEFRRFFKRANIVQLQVHSSARVLPELLLFGLPNIQILIFRNAYIFGDEPCYSLPCPKLREIHFISCTLHTASLWLVAADSESLREVTVWDSKIDNKGREHPLDDFKPALTEACPVVRFLDKSDYGLTIKVEGWGEDIDERIKNAVENNYAME